MLDAFQNLANTLNVQQIQTVDWNHEEPEVLSLCHWAINVLLVFRNQPDYLQHSVQEISRRLRGEYGINFSLFYIVKNSDDVIFIRVLECTFEVFQDQFCQ